MIITTAMLTASAQAANTLWYDKPAKAWLESLPIGNGRVGGMVFGGPAEERIALNEITFWSGESSENHDSPQAANAFAQIRTAFAAGKYDGLQPLIHKIFGRELNYGSNLPAGDLFVTQTGVSGGVTDYRRELDLESAVAKVSFVSGGVHFHREVLASHPDGVMALRWTADRPGSIGFALRYAGGSFPWTARVKGTDTLTVTGRAFEKHHSNNKTGVTFAAAIRVLPEGGTIKADGDAVRLDGADAATVLIAINTDYQKSNPVAQCDDQINGAATKGWRAIAADHVSDYQRLFGRVSLELGGDNKDGVPIDMRLAAYRGGKPDNGLEALFFQYGRYLLISGSREDSPLPMHLQGLWNDSLAAAMAWTCDFHLDINTEQTYWPTESCNLSECAQPLFRLIESLQKPGHETAKKTYGIDHGWVCHVFTNPWGFTAPGWGADWGIHVVGGAWISTHLWEHYLFTGDRPFLADQAYPVLKGAAEFFLDYLYVDPSTGYLLTGPSVSPERGGEAGMGSVHDRAVIFELFTSCIEASRILGVNADFRARVESARAKLPPYQIGRNGQLQEWVREDDGGQTNHRHTSHLVGLFPFSQITPIATPALAKAARKSLTLRMESPDWEDVEWSAGNAICYYARLCDGAAASRNLHNLLSSDTDTDLLTFSRGGVAGAVQNIFSIDGNFAGTAGIAEMLLQSQNGEIDLLPALPPQWANGKVTGLRARGNFTVDITWEGGKVTDYRVTSPTLSGVKVRVNGEVKTVQAKP